MPATPTTAVNDLLAQYDKAWKDDTPVFGCCRKSVAAAVDSVDVLEAATLDVTARVRAMRAAVDEQSPGYFDTHRCCAGHLADLAFDLPDLLVADSTGS
jgi:hypothetical protein